MSPYPASVAIGKPDDAMLQSADQLLVTARQSYAVITTADQCEAAGDDLKAIKTKQKALEDARTTITKPLLEVQRAVNALFKKPMDALAEAERLVKNGILKYQDAEERKRREAEAVAAEAARKEREKLEAQAARAAAAGRMERAEALAATAAAIPERVEIQSAAPKIAGLSKRGIWKAEVTDKAAFAKYAAEHPEWLHLLDVNLTALNGLARSQKDALSLPGVRAFEEKILGSTAG